MQLKDFTVVTTLPVQWGEMDSAQHVNNVVYLRYAETGRIAYFEKLGFAVSPEDNEAGFILGWQDCKYIFPLTFPDKVHIGVRVSEIGNDRFTMECHMFSDKHQRIAAISTHRIVTYNYKTLKKVDIPEALHKSIREIEGLS